MPYVGFRSVERHGRFINVSAEGIRKTVQPELNPDQPVTNIFTFGGSVMFGQGNEDWNTIPSILAQSLHQSGINARVTNYAAKAHVSTQELLTLLTLLQQENIPDTVIFLNGYNEGTAVRPAGTSARSNVESAEFQLLNRKSNKLQRAYWLAVLHDSAVVKAMKWLLKKAGLYKPASSSSPALRFPLYPDVESSPFAQAERLLQVYQTNRLAIDSLAKTYGFNALFYWQPMIAHKNRLSESEKFIQTEGLLTFRNTLYQAARDYEADLSRQGHYRSLQDIFVDDLKPAFVDSVHLTAYGSKRVADVIAGDVLLLSSRSIEVDREESK